MVITRDLFSNIHLPTYTNYGLYNTTWYVGHRLHITTSAGESFAAQEKITFWLSFRMKIGTIV